MENTSSLCNLPVAGWRELLTKYDFLVAMGNGVRTLIDWTTCRWVFSDYAPEGYHVFSDIDGREILIYKYNININSRTSLLNMLATPGKKYRIPVFHIEVDGLTYMTLAVGGV